MKRAALYALVWERPVTQVARSFGMSDVGLRKLCAKHGIPTPPSGYWTKLAHGKQVIQTPLPPLEDGRDDDIDLHPSTDRRHTPDIAEIERCAIQEDARDDRHVVVPTERPNQLHVLAAATEKSLRK